MISVATGKELKGTGVWSFIKVPENSTTGRAAILAVFAALAFVVVSPGAVTALTTDASINP